MSRRVHAASWLAAIVLLVAAEPFVCTEPALHRFDAATQPVLDRADPRLAAAATAFVETIAPRAGPAAAEVRGSNLPMAGAASLPAFRCPAAWRRVLLRLALVAGGITACSPILLAGLVDGLVMRGAHRRRSVASPRAGHAGSHVLILMVVAPLVWAVTPLAAGPLVLPAWALACAATLSFTASHTGGVIEG